MGRDHPRDRSVKVVRVENFHLRAFRCRSRAYTSGVKTIFSFSVLVLLSVTASAQGTKPKPAKAPKTILCAVMPDDKVDITKATKNGMFQDFKGRRYFFCCAGCPDAFKKNPEKFITKGAKSIPTPKK